MRSSTRRHLLAFASVIGLCAFQAGASVAQAPSADSGDEAATVIVTGTREPGVKARRSATPIDVISASDLKATGATNLLDALRDILPSIQAPAVGYDVGALARTYQLRGLSPSHTLVLINGKRRHLSASLYADSDPAQGANAVDLDLIPLNAIERVEVLRDGAAAQYGSDAIAGVVNVILKSDADSGTLSVLGGSYYKGDGRTAEVDIDKGFKIGRTGALHLSLGLRHHGFSNRSGDSGGPESAKVQGDPKSDVGTLGYNYANPFNDRVTAYSFGTLASRKAQAYENPRQPTWLSDAVDALYPKGFTPIEAVDETDFSVTAGLKGRAPWDWDLSSTYGGDKVRLRNTHTVNPILLGDTGNTQSDFYVGGFSSTEWTTNLDLRRGFDIGLAAPLNLAIGVEDRFETFRIDAGEANSYYGGGPSAFPGFRPSDTADAHRNSVATYADATLHPTEAWEVATAVRAEHYDHVGDTQTGKISTRYAISPRLALRATVSSGFHAPTLAQQYYSATTVTTDYAAIQLPLGSPGAKVLGAPDLKPETSKNLSLGFVAEPFTGVHLSADAFSTEVDDRIIESAYLYGALAQAAVAANGSVIPAGLSSDNVSAVFFTNGVDTRTEGLDVRLDGAFDLWAGRLRWALSASHLQTKIEKVHAAPKVLGDAGLTLVDAVQVTNLTSATPKTKVSLAGTWKAGAWSVALRNTYYSNAVQAQGYSAPYYLIETGDKVITDLDVGYRFNERLTIDIGADNLFNVYPQKIAAAVYQNLNYDKYSHVAPFGINGGYYYVRLTSSF